MPDDKKSAWYDSGGNLVINLKRATIVYFATGNISDLWVGGNHIKDLYSVKIEQEGDDYPKVTIEPAERDDD